MSDTDRQERTVPNHIRRFRTAHGMTVAELAEAIYVDPSTLSRWENGVTQCPDTMKLALGEFFHVPATTIFEFHYDLSVDALLRLLDQVTVLNERVARLEGAA